MYRILYLFIHGCCQWRKKTNYWNKMNKNTWNKDFQCESVKLRLTLVAHRESKLYFTLWNCNNMDKNPASDQRSFHFLVGPVSKSQSLLVNCYFETYEGPCWQVLFLLRQLGNEKGGPPKCNKCIFIVFCIVAVDSSLNFNYKCKHIKMTCSAEPHKERFAWKQTAGIQALRCLPCNGWGWEAEQMIRSRQVLMVGGCQKP